MKDMFDMISGTSTGSIISAALTYHAKDKDKENDGRVTPKFFASDVIDVYANQGDRIFSKHASASDSGPKTILLGFFVAAWGVGFYFIGKYFYDNEETKENFSRIDKILGN